MYIHARGENEQSIGPVRGGYSIVEYHLHIRLNHVFQVFPHMQIFEGIIQARGEERETTH